MMPVFKLWFAILAFSFACSVHAAITVAPADALPEEKSRADLICDGVDDQQQLAESLARARMGEAIIDIDPKTQQKVTCRKNHAVQWLPGNYHLSETLEIADAADCVIQAEGTVLHYAPDHGDCVVIRGMNRCRYNFGTIKTKSDGAALRIQPGTDMPSLMSFINFMGLIGSEQRGIGLMLDPQNENVCVNRFVGTDVYGFDKGVYVGDAGEREGSASTQSKCDTNWFWVSYVRLCKTCVEEASRGVDCSVWEINVDASIPDSVAIRAGGAFSKWYVIMGTFTFEGQNRAVVLTPGARHNVMEVHPPLDMFAWEDRSGNDTNIVLASSRPPFRKFSQLRDQTPAQNASDASGDNAH